MYSKLGCQLKNAKGSHLKIKGVKFILSHLGNAII